MRPRSHRVRLPRSLGSVFPRCLEKRVNCRFLRHHCPDICVPGYHELRNHLNARFFSVESGLGYSGYPRGYPARAPLAAAGVGCITAPIGPLRGCCCSPPPAHVHPQRLKVSHSKGCHEQLRNTHRRCTPNPSTRPLTAGLAQFAMSMRS